MSKRKRPMKATDDGGKGETETHFSGMYPKYHDLHILPIFLRIPGSVFCTQKSDFGYLIGH